MKARYPVIGAEDRSKPEILSIRELRSWFGAEPDSHLMARLSGPSAGWYILKLKLGAVDTSLHPQEDGRVWHDFRRYVADFRSRGATAFAARHRISKHLGILPDLWVSA